MHTLELFQLRDLVKHMGIGHYEAVCVRYTSGRLKVFTVAIVSSNGEVYHLRIKHSNKIRVFKTEKAVSEAITAIGFQSKNTLFVDSVLHC